MRCITIPLTAATLLAAFMALGLIADGALRRVELANQEAFTAAPRTASDTAR